MFNDDMTRIDTDRLRDDLREEAMGAFFGGGFGGGLVSAGDIDRASDEELKKMARKSGLDIGRYRR